MVFQSRKAGKNPHKILKNITLDPRQKIKILRHSLGDISLSLSLFVSILKTDNFPDFLFFA